MLAARASAARAASRIARNFATVVDSAGVKVAAADNGEPTSAVTFIVKAGSRFEPKPGVAHALKNYAFKVGLRSLYPIIRCESGIDGGDIEHGQAFCPGHGSGSRALRRCPLHKPLEGAPRSHCGVFARG